jgi:hypothetical protein
LSFARQGGRGARGLCDGGSGRQPLSEVRPHSLKTLSTPRTCWFHPPSPQHPYNPAHPQLTWRVVLHATLQPCCICAAQSSQIKITRNMGTHQQAAPRTSPPAALSLRARAHSDLLDVVRKWRAVPCLCSLSPRLPCQHGASLFIHPRLPQRKEEEK